MLDWRVLWADTGAANGPPQHLVWRGGRLETEALVAAGDELGGLLEDRLERRRLLLRLLRGALLSRIALEFDS